MNFDEWGSCWADPWFRVVTPHVISFAQSNCGCAFPLFQCVCSNADPVEGGGGVVWRKAAEERDVCLGVCVCVWRVGASLYCGSWCRGLGAVKKWGSPPLPAEPHTCGLVCLRLLVNTAQLNTSSWCARPHCTAALRGACRNRGHELRNKPRTVWCWKKFLKHCICVQDHSNLSSHHLWMRLIEIRHQTKSAVKPAVNNKKNQTCITKTAAGSS